MQECYLTVPHGAGTIGSTLTNFLDEEMMQQRTRWITASIGTLLGLMLITCAAFADVPGAPTNLAAELQESNGVTDVLLTWDRNSDHVSHYRIYMSTDSGSTYTRIGRVIDSIG